jgi:hypothetical protein
VLVRIIVTAMSPCVFGYTLCNASRGRELRDLARLCGGVSGLLVSEGFDGS